MHGVYDLGTVLMVYNCKAIVLIRDSSKLYSATPCTSISALLMLLMPTTTANHAITYTNTLGKHCYYDNYERQPGMTAGACAPIVREIAVVFWRRHSGKAAGAPTQ